MIHLGGGHRAKAERGRVADRCFLEQERGGADGDQIEEALVDLDREGGPLEVSAHPVGHVLEIGRDARSARRRRRRGPGGSRTTATMAGSARPAGWRPAARLRRQRCRRTGRRRSVAPARTRRPGRYRAAAARRRSIRARAAPRARDARVHARTPCGPLRATGLSSSTSFCCASGHDVKEYIPISDAAVKGSVRIGERHEAGERRGADGAARDKADTA